MPATTSTVVAPSRRSTGAPAARAALDHVADGAVAHACSPSARRRPRTRRARRAGARSTGRRRSPTRCAARTRRRRGCGRSRARAYSCASAHEVRLRDARGRRGHVAPVELVHARRLRAPGRESQPQAVARAPRRGAQHQVGGARRHVLRDQLAIGLEAAGGEHQRDVARAVSASGSRSRTSLPRRAAASRSARGCRSACRWSADCPSRAPAARAPSDSSHARSASRRSNTVALQRRVAAAGTPTGTGRTRDGAR